MNNENLYNSTPQNGNMPNQRPPQGQGNDGMATASMILGIIALVFSCVYYVSLPCSIIGLILGISFKKKNGKESKSTAGIICSIIALGLIVLLFILYIIFGVASFAAALSTIEQF